MANKKQDNEGTKEEIEFLHSKGWNFVKGIRINPDNIEEGMNYYDELSDLVDAEIVSEVWFWTNGDEFATEDIKEALEFEQYPGLQKKKAKGVNK